MGMFSRIGKVAHRRYRTACGGIDNNQFDFHFFRQDAFDVNGGNLIDLDSLFQFRETGEVRRQFHEDAVGLNGADDAGDGLPRGEERRVLFPVTEQLPVGDVNASLVVDALDDCEDAVARLETDARVRNAGDGDAVDGQEGNKTASDVDERPEVLEMRDGGGNDVARD